jgi:uncharacterized coiled-coil protein SlyX
MKLEKRINELEEIIKQQGQRIAQLEQETKSHDGELTIISDYMNRPENKIIR